MIVTVTKPDSDACISLDVSEDTEMSLLRVLIENELNIPAKNQLLLYNNQPLSENTTIKSAGIKEGSIIILINNVESVPPQRQNMENILSSLDMLDINKMDTSLQGAKLRAEELLKLHEIDELSIGRMLYFNKDLMDSIKAKDLDRAAGIIYDQQLRYRNAVDEKRNKINNVLTDPFAVESQRFLEEQLQQQQLDESYRLAQEYLPEAFGDVFMVYVDMEVNGISLRAFVDSGAQTTIMSKACAERCNLMRLVDCRFQGIAQGVGTSRIVGRIHVAQLKIGKNYFPVSFTVIEDDKLDFLFGLDMLRRYQCCLDFKRNVLVIGGEDVPFLSEGDSNAICTKSSSSVALTSGGGGSPSFRDGVGNTNKFKPEKYQRLQDEEKHEQSIKILMELGFTRDQSEEGLIEMNGSIELAAAFLYRQYS